MNVVQEEWIVVKNRQIRRLLTAGFCILAVTFAAAGAGAAGDTFRQSAELGKRTGKTSEDVDKYANQLDKTEQALSSVSQAQSKGPKEAIRILLEASNQA